MATPKFPLFEIPLLQQVLTMAATFKNVPLPDLLSGLNEAGQVPTYESIGFAEGDKQRVSVPVSAAENVADVVSYQMLDFFASASRHDDHGKMGLSLFHFYNPHVLRVFTSYLDDVFTGAGLNKTENPDEKTEDNFVVERRAPDVDAELKKVKPNLFMEYEASYIIEFPLSKIDAVINSALKLLSQELAKPKIPLRE